MYIQVLFCMLKFKKNSNYCTVNVCKFYTLLVNIDSLVSDSDADKQCLKLPMSSATITKFSQDNDVNKKCPSQMSEPKHIRVE